MLVANNNSSHFCAPAVCSVPPFCLSVLSLCVPAPAASAPPTTTTTRPFPEHSHQADGCRVPGVCTLLCKHCWRRGTHLPVLLWQLSSLLQHALASSCQQAAAPDNSKQHTAAAAVLAAAAQRVAVVVDDQPTAGAATVVLVP